MKEMQQSEDFRLEEAFEKLEGLIASLEDPTLTLEQSFQSYQQGMTLLKQCEAQIDLVEKQVTLLGGEGTLDEKD